MAIHLKRKKMMRLFMFLIVFSALSSLEFISSNASNRPKVPLSNAHSINKHSLHTQQKLSPTSQASHCTCGFYCDCDSECDSGSCKNCINTSIVLTPLLTALLLPSISIKPLSNPISFYAYNPPPELPPPLI